MTKIHTIQNPSEHKLPETQYTSALFVLVTCFGLTSVLGATFWSFGVFFKPLQEEFGWSRALTSSIFSFFLFGYAVSAVISGKMVDRYKPGPSLFASSILLGFGFCFCSFASSIHHFQTLLFLAGLGAGATWSVPTSTVQRWFYKNKKAGLALGVVVSGVGFGALLFAPLTNLLIDSFGWRTAFLVIGILFFFTLVIAAMVIKPAPQNTLAAGGDTRVKPLFAFVRSSETGQLIISRAFAGVAFMLSIGLFNSHMLSAHLVPYAVDRGISATASAAALGLIGGFSIPGRILAGLCSARFGWSKLLSISFFGTAASIVLLWSLENAWAVHAFALSYGIFHGIRIASEVGIILEIFGIFSTGELIGISSAIGQIIASSAPYLAGVIFDVTASYDFVFLTILLSSLAAGFVALGIMRYENRSSI